ncbi:hypothetical protein ACEPAF_7874 [Sanghuangporus sanghuang]
MMTTSRQWRTYGTGRTARRHPKKLSRRQTNFLRKLIHVLTEVVDESDLPEDSNGMPWLEERGSETGTRDAKDEQKRLQEMVSKFVPANVIYLQNFPEKHDALVNHVKALLNTLGGGERTAKALERMKDGIDMAFESFYQDYSAERTYLNVDDCVKALSALGDIVLELTYAIREFGVFSTGFFDSLSSVSMYTQDIASQLDQEFGCDGEVTRMECNVDKYLDSMLYPLVKSLETYIQELTSVAEKEIPAIRQSQEFCHRNDTTNYRRWSCFHPYYDYELILVRFTGVQYCISSLQPSGDDVAAVAYSPTRLFITIVGSYLASERTNVCSDSGFDDLLDWIERDVSAAVPTVFAGFHAYAIFFLSAWYLSEQWKARHPKGRKGMVDQVKTQIKHRGKTAILSVGNVLNSKHFWTRDGTPRRDVEKGPDQQSSHPSTHHSSPSASSLGQQHPGPEEDLPARDTKSAIPESLSLAEPSRHCIDSSEGISSPADIWSARHEDLIQFSADCSFLASAFSRVVSIYETRYSFEILKTIVVQDASPVRQILWNPNKHNNLDYIREVGQGDLVVRSSEGVYIKTPVHRLVELDCAVGPVRWIRERDNGLTGLSCLLDNSLKVFELPFFDASGISSSKDGLPYEDKNCKELYSFDFSDLSFTGPVLDALLYQKDRIVCLTGTRGDRTRVIVIDREAKSIKQTYDVFSRHTSMSVSQASGRIFLRGGGIADIIEPDGLASVDSVHDVFRSSEEKLQERAVGCLGKHEKFVFIVDDTEIGIFRRSLLPGFAYTRRLHVFTTPFTRAVVENLVSFAVGHSNPYLFAFGSSDGSVKIWSIQNNDSLHHCEGAQLFEVHDNRDWSHVEVSVGRFLTLSPPDISGRD